MKFSTVANAIKFRMSMNNAHRYMIVLGDDELIWVEHIKKRLN